MAPQTEHEAFRLKRGLVYQKLRDLIAGKYFQPGAKLPREVILCGQMGVSRGTLRAALARLEQEGYIERCHPGGTRVTGGMPRRILVVLPSDLNGLSPAFYAYPAVEECCRRHRLEMHTVLYQQLPGEIAEPESYLGALLLCVPWEKDEPCRLLRKYPFPKVIACADPGSGHLSGFACVGFDFRRELLAAVRYLMDLGHRRISYISSVTSRRFPLSELRAFCESSGIPESASLIREFSEYPEIRSVVRELMHLSAPPTALLCYNDHVALEVYAELKSLNLSIPDDVVVMNTFGVANGVLLKPDLTYIDSAHALAVKTAFDLLLHWKERQPGTPEPHVVIPCNIVSRRSTLKMFLPSAGTPGREEKPSSKKEVKQ
ncbi:MAG: substrate-binding domain-containing protein [Lentisphaeria bacterium]|nr:substrate-binding domain-containing protein [Lentisphaeria bacterium]